MIPVSTTVVNWGKIPHVKINTNEKDEYFGHDPHLISLVISRVEGEEYAKVQMRFGSYQNGKSEDLPGNRVDLSSQTSVFLSDTISKVGLEWMSHPVFCDATKEFRFSAIERGLSFTQQAILLARKIDRLLIHPSNQGVWLKSGEIYRVSHVTTLEYGRESYFDYLLREQLGIPIDDV